MHRGVFASANGEIPAGKDGSRIALKADTGTVTFVLTRAARNIP